MSKAGKITAAISGAFLLLIVVAIILIATFDWNRLKPTINQKVSTELNRPFAIRGDLGVEIDFTELPGIQKTIIDRSFSFGKPIVTATQMLDSMIVNPRPTRAEISDVANAIYDGTSAIMLSGETAAGAYPVEALKTMSAIAERTEQEGFHLRGRMMDSNPGKISVSDATAHCRLPDRTGCERRCHRYRV